MLGLLFSALGLGFVAKEAIEDELHTSSNKSKAILNNKKVYLDSKGRWKSTSTDRVVTWAYDKQLKRNVYVDSLDYLDGKWTVVYDPDKQKAEEFESKRKKEEEEYIKRTIEMHKSWNRKVICFEHKEAFNFYYEYYDIKTKTYFTLDMLDYEHNYAFELTWIENGKQYKKIIEGEELDYLLKLKKEPVTIYDF